MSAPVIAAVVLAGGLGTRLGARVPKPLVAVGGRPMIAHVLSRIPAWIDPILIAANDADAFAALDHPVVPDRIDGRKGPLAGLDAAAAWLRLHRPAITHLLCLPGDTPFLPDDLAARLGTRSTGRPRLARFEGRLQPTVALWPLPLLDRLVDHLRASEDLSVKRFAAQDGEFDIADFESSVTAPSGNPFFNVNTPDDLAKASAFFGG